MSISDDHPLARLTAETPVRYIKLGRGGAEEAECLDKGELRVFFPFIPHELALQGDKAAMAAAARSDRKSDAKAGDAARQVHDFYHLGADALWITFSGGKLWWAFAEPEAVWVDRENEPYRMRRVIGRWRSESMTGEPLQMAELSGKLTKTAAYRETLCEIEDAKPYLIAKLTGRESPKATRARASRSEMIAAVAELVRHLGPQDFELLVDLILTRSGWRRISAVGGAQKIVDMELTLPITGERAFAQVKSQSTQSEFGKYLAEAKARGADWMFYAVHSGPTIEPPAGAKCIIIDQKRSAEMAIDAGLYDWIAQRVA